MGSRRPTGGELGLAESSNWDWTVFAVLTQLRGANAPSAPCPSLRPQQSKAISNAEGCSQSNCLSIPFPIEHRTMPSVLWPRPLIWPKRKFRKLLSTLVLWGPPQLRYLKDSGIEKPNRASREWCNVRKQMKEKKKGLESWKYVT
jgi:hypothetical protein